MKYLLIAFMILTTACGKNKNNKSNEDSLTYACSYRETVDVKLCTWGCSVYRAERYDCISSSGEVCEASIKEGTNALTGTTCLKQIALKSSMGFQ